MARLGIYKELIKQNKRDVSLSWDGFSQELPGTYIICTRIEEIIHLHAALEKKNEIIHLHASLKKKEEEVYCELSYGICGKDLWLILIISFFNISSS